MQIPIGNSIRVVVAGTPRPRKQYAAAPDGTRTVVGTEIDGSGTPLAGFVATLASPTVGWTEGASVIAPAPLLEALAPAGTVVELSGNLMLSIRGGDYGATRATVTGVAGVKALGSVIEAVSAMAATPERASR